MLDVAQGLIRRFFERTFFYPQRTVFLLADHSDFKQSFLRTEVICLQTGASNCKLRDIFVNASACGLAGGHPKPLLERYPKLHKSPAYNARGLISAQICAGRLAIYRNPDSGNLLAPLPIGICNWAQNLSSLGICLFSVPPTALSAIFRNMGQANQFPPSSSYKVYRTAAKARHHRSTTRDRPGPADILGRATFPA